MKKPDATHLLTERDQPRRWVPPAELAEALEPILRANMTRSTRVRVGAPRVTEWLAEHGCTVGQSSVGRWMAERTGAIRKESQK